MADYFVLSNFGTHYFLAPFTDANTVPESVTPDLELNGIISCDIGSFSKENTKYRTLNSNGWESVASLGNTSEDATFECIREGVGDVYTGKAGTTTYTKIRDWFMKATAGAGVASPMCLVEILPRGGAGDAAYEGTCYYVIPNSWNPNTRDTESGQEFSFTVTPFGPPVPVGVTYSKESGEKWTLAKK